MKFTKYIKSLSLIILFALTLCSCGPKVVPDRVEPRKEYLSANPEDLFQDLLERNRRIKSLRSTGNLEFRFTYSTRDYRGTEIVMAVEKPAKVYVRGDVSVVGDVFTLVSDGEKFWAEIPSEDEVYTGSVGTRVQLEHRVESEKWSGFDPTVLSEALLIDDLDNYDHILVQIYPKYYIIEIVEESESGKLLLRRQIWFERERLTVERHRIYNESGEVMTEAYLYRYKEIDGLNIPQYFRIERYWEEMSLRLELEDIRLNPEFPGDFFQYEVPAGFKLIDLDERVTEDAESGKS